MCAVSRLPTGCFSVTSTIAFSKTSGPALPPSQPTVREVIRVFARGKSGDVVKLITRRHLAKVKLSHYRPRQTLRVQQG